MFLTFNLFFIARFECYWFCLYVGCISCLLFGMLSCVFLFVFPVFFLWPTLYYTLVWCCNFRLHFHLLPLLFFMLVWWGFVYAGICPFSCTTHRSLLRPPIDQHWTPDHLAVFGMLTAHVLPTWVHFSLTKSPLCTASQVCSGRKNTSVYIPPHILTASPSIVVPSPTRLYVHLPPPIVSFYVLTSPTSPPQHTYPYTQYVRPNSGI